MPRVYYRFICNLATLKGEFVCSYLESDLKKPDSLLEIKERSAELKMDSAQFQSPSFLTLIVSLRYLPSPTYVNYNFFFVASECRHQCRKSPCNRQDWRGIRRPDLHMKTSSLSQLERQRQRVNNCLAKRSFK